MSKWREQNGCVTNFVLFLLESVGFTLDGNVCYYVSKPNERKSWEDSRAFCRSKQADLVIIDSQEKKVCLCSVDFNSIELNSIWYVISVV